jgi:hypothetical protein
MLTINPYDLCLAPPIFENVTYFFYKLFSLFYNSKTSSASACNTFNPLLVLFSKELNSFYVFSIYLYFSLGQFIYKKMVLETWEKYKKMVLETWEKAHLTGQHF